MHSHMLFYLCFCTYRFVAVPFALQDDFSIPLMARFLISIVFLCSTVVLFFQVSTDRFEPYSALFSNKYYRKIALIAKR